MLDDIKLKNKSKQKNKIPQQIDKSEPNDYVQVSHSNNTSISSRQIPHLNHSSQEKHSHRTSGDIKEPHRTSNANKYHQKPRGKRNCTCKRRKQKV